MTPRHLSLVRGQSPATSASLRSFLVLEFFSLSRPGHFGGAQLVVSFQLNLSTFTPSSYVKLPMHEDRVIQAATPVQNRKIANVAA